MDLNGQKEQFSQAYVRAITAVAGFTLTKPDVDDDSVDFTIAHRGGHGTTRLPRLDLQLKCTGSVPPLEPEFSFALKKKNYDDLRHEDFMVPRILVIVIVPVELSEWVTHSEESLVLWRCGYWLSLRGAPASDNHESVTIHVPRAQRFSVERLAMLMTNISNGTNP